MNGETEPILRTPNRRLVANMTDFLEQLRSSGNIHFWKALPKTALDHPRQNPRQTAKVSLPKTFVEDHGDKFEELVTLRVRRSSGRSSRSWLVHCSVAATLKVAIVGGWADFVIDNHLQKGDFVVFVLREDARSEFEVHVFRGSRKFPYFPGQGERSDELEEEEEKFSSDSEKEQTGNPRVPPRFSKRLKASHIGRSSGENHSGQFEFPFHFIKAHGEHVHDSVKLQGIHENSRNYVMLCRRRPTDLLKFLSKTPATGLETVPGTRSNNFSRWQHSTVVEPGRRISSRGRGLAFRSQQPFLRKIV